MTTVYLLNGESYEVDELDLQDWAMSGFLTLDFKDSVITIPFHALAYVEESKIDDSEDEVFAPCLE